MVDRALFTDMGGAKQSLTTLRLIANNLANTNTIGFRADYATSKPTHDAHSKNTRVSSAIEGTYTDFKPGPLVHTGRELDVAIDGAGFLAVQNKKGEEAYTRAGDFELTQDGLLMTAKGDIVLGDGGIITIPPATHISIDKKGIITAQLVGQPEKTLTQVGKLKLVEAPANQLEKGEDGLIYMKDRSNAFTSDQVKLAIGYLEGSNVEPIRSLTELIDMSRQFEVHTKLMKSVEDNSYKANQLLDTES